MEGKPRILIVDDETIVCDMAKRSFELEGYEVTVYTDSTAALAALQENSFDVLITDLKMKNVDGLQLLEFSKQHWPDMKVIILTAFGTLETAVTAFHKEAFDYFTKPVRIKDLGASVHRAVNAGRVNQEESNNG
jgi:DNA-binding NtrC family response regulator